MYAAHAEEKRKETSRQHLQSSLNILERDLTDNEKFAAILEITHYLRKSIFTDEDQQIILRKVGLEFITRLLKSRPESHSLTLYKAIVLSLMATWSKESEVISHPDMPKFLYLVNDVLIPNSSYDKRKNPDDMHQSMCGHCEEIVFNLSCHKTGVTHLVDCQTFQIFVDYILRSQCQNILQGLASLSNIVKYKGDTVLQDCSSKHHDLLTVVVDRLDQGSDLQEKGAYVKILITFINAVHQEEDSLHQGWLGKLAGMIRTWIQHRMAQDAAETVMSLVGALVNAAGAEALSPSLTGDTTLLRAVVASISVEVYLLLDCISEDNISHVMSGTDQSTERYPKLDRVYKLVLDIVKYLADAEDSVDSDSIIVIYRKLVEISDTITEFLCCVASHQIQLPQNHCVVLISIRTLAAMLTEITEDPTSKLLELLPFLNLLCQNVEYSNDVVMEVKNVTQAALENIKLMNESEENKKSSSRERQLEEPPPTEKELDLNALSNLEMPPRDSLGATWKSEADKNIDHAFGQMSVTTNVSSRYSGSSGIAAVNLTTARNTPGIHSSGQAQADNLQDSCQATTDAEHEQEHADILLTEDSLNKFKAFQNADLSNKCKSLPVTAKIIQKLLEDQTSSLGDSQFWKPTPNDVLGYLLPAYAFLLDNDEVEEVMVRSDIFQTVVSFLEASLSSFLEQKSVSYPESLTINALSMIEQLYINSPATAARLQCCQHLFEISVLSIPNLVNLSHPPPYVSLKFLELCLLAYRLQMRGIKRISTLKHSQCRFFKAAIEYLRSFYSIRHRQGRSPQLNGAVRSVWPLVEDCWCGCIAGLCTLVKSVDILQDVLLKSTVIPEFLVFLRDADPELTRCTKEGQKMTESMMSLIESTAEGSNLLCQMMIQNQGKLVGRKFSLQKLIRCIENYSKASQTDSGVTG